MTLVKAVLAFAQAAQKLAQAPAVMDALASTTKLANVRPFCGWWLPRRYPNYMTDFQLGRTTVVYSGAPRGLFEALLRQAQVNGSIEDLMTRATTASVTLLARAAHDLRPTGRYAWVQPTLAQYGIRDMLICPFRTWALTYIAEAPLKLELATRLALDMAAKIAVERFEAILPPIRGDGSSIPKVTGRERQILYSLRHGAQNQEEIAARMGLSQKTVSEHLTKMRLKFGVDTNEELVAEAMQYRYI